MKVFQNFFAVFILFILWSLFYYFS